MTHRPALRSILRCRHAIGVLAILGAGIAHAQDAPVRGLERFDTPAGRPTPAPIPIPAAPVIVLPTPTLTPNPTPTPTPSATPTPVRSRPLPSPSPTATPARAAPGPTPTQTPTARETDPARSPPTITPTAAPRPAILAPAKPAPAQAPSWWPWLLGVALLAFAGIAIGAIRRRRASAPVVRNDRSGPAPKIPAVPVAVDRTPAHPTPAGLTLDVRPIRAGLNLLSATVECEITVTNAGDAAVEAIHLDVRLASAHAGLDEDLAGLAQQPIGRPAVPPFALAATQSRTVRKILALPREAIRVMTAGDRPMFVPVVATTALYRANDTDHRVTTAFAVGVERVDSPKLAPLWLDGAPRMFDNVAARPHVSRPEPR